ncbi:deaminated glutathione amidase-like [Saccoglossus kowalevskii]|uniref:Nitrilase homolog 1-like n=1 Tax=Saccoglossus kowalevskii TaxID=10224 RepID=A0ABM0GYP2_SACKO|nr:PREDICTED: nitrilase homolog 1-like [Saccoglossus kowalevskii]
MMLLASFLRNYRLKFTNRSCTTFLTISKRTIKMAAISERKRGAIAVCQLNCRSDKNDNLKTCSDLIAEAKLKGAKMAFLPEGFDYIADSRQKSIDMAEPIDGHVITTMKSLAKQHNMWLSLGGMHHKDVSQDEESRINNCHVIINNTGDIVAKYNKTHLFDVDIKGHVRLKESDYTIPGSRIVPPVTTPLGKVGLATCYDLRFPEMSLALAEQGAEILTFPSAFTFTTGAAHWEILLRSRAIETQCYVVAAAQTGKHHDRRTSYGHSMVVDPWGCVIACCHEGVDVCVVDIDLDYQQKIRTEMPVWNHRRYDLYGKITTQPSDVVSERSDT